MMLLQGTSQIPRRNRAVLGRLAALLFCLATGLGIAAADDRDVGLDSCSGGSSEPIKVAEVIDGETLSLEGGRIIRLAGIELPRPVAESSGLDDRFAEQAQVRLSALVTGKSVMLGPELGTDRHGRVRAFVHIEGGRLLQNVLLGEGLARVYRFPGENVCLSTLLAAERAARGARIGLWAVAEYDVKKANDPSLRQQIGLYELVEGRVISVGVRSSMVFLNFGREWQRDFTVMIAKPLVARFAEAGTPVETFAKRRVRVRGVVEESGGPAIRIGDPSDIELLDD